jgi:hypothetical protein
MSVLGACWAQAHFGEKAQCGGKAIGRKACEVCMQEEGKERPLAGKAVDENVHAEEKNMQDQHAIRPN